MSRSRFDITSLRLRSQRLAGTPCATAADVVGWFGAVQAQDFAGAQWAIAQRTRDARRADLDRAADSGELLRTHVLRPTWHFVRPADLRWLLALTAPRVKRAMATYDRKLGLDDRTFARATAAISTALAGGKQLTRPELTRVLARHKLAATGQRLGHLLMRAELDAAVCSGSRRGAQHTYALVDDRCPPTAPLDRDHALGDLAARYFTSHGPALALDFAWWAGLSLTDARRAIDLAHHAHRDQPGQPPLASHTIDDRTYWFAEPATTPRARRPVVHLLPNFDEYLVAYKRRAASLAPAVFRKLGSRADLLFNHLVTLDGDVIGAWRRTLGRADVTITTSLSTQLTRPEQRALDAAVARLGTYLGLPTQLASR